LRNIACLEFLAMYDNMIDLISLYIYIALQKDVYAACICRH
jgi:hypothetical protein